MKSIGERVGLYNVLESIWEQQRKYNDTVKGLQTEKQNWSEVYLLGLVAQVHDVLEQLQWKRHRANGSKPRWSQREQVAPSLADLTKYVFCLWQEQGFTLEEMLEEVRRVNKQLDYKLQMEFFPASGRKYIVTDLDGTGADYRTGFEKWWGKPDTVKTLNVDLDNGVPFDQYAVQKTEFEATGGYATLPVYEDWARLVLMERARGTGLMVTTARPANELKRIWNDTMNWLQHYGISPDSIVFGRDERIIELVKLGGYDNMVVLLEDDATLALRAANSGIPVMLRTQPWNLAAQHPLVHRFEKFPDAIPWDEYYVAPRVPKIA